MTTTEAQPSDPRAHLRKRIGEAIRQVRGSMSQGSFGELLESELGEVVPQTTISRWESGQVAHDAEVLIAIERAVGVKRGTILLLADAMDDVSAEDLSQFAGGVTPSHLREILAEALRAAADALFADPMQATALTTPLPVTAREPDLVTIEQAARRLAIHRSTAYELIKRDEFPVPVIKVGSQLRVPRTALDDFVAAAGGRTGRNR